MYDYQFSNAALTAWVMLGQTWDAMYKVAERKLAKLGLTPEKLGVLWACKENAPPITPAKLSRLVFRESQTITTLLSRMERDGLVTRVPKEKGHPFTEVKMTAKGEELCCPGIEVVRSLLEVRIMTALSAEEIEQLIKLVRKLRENTLEELHLELLPPPSYAGG